MQEYIKLLGFEVRDRVTGFSGVVSSIAFDLYGCVQAIVCPKADKKGVRADSGWFDTKRLIITSPKPVMKVPTFEVVPGPERKPLPPHI